MKIGMMVVVVVVVVVVIRLLDSEDVGDCVNEVCKNCTSSHTLAVTSQLIIMCTDDCGIIYRLMITASSCCNTNRIGRCFKYGRFF